MSAAPPPISACLKLSASDKCPPIRSPSPVRVQSVTSPWLARASPPPRRRPSRNSWIRPSLTDARPSPVRQKSVGRLVCRPSEARCASVSRRAICRRARTPHEPTQDERHTGRDRTQNEQPTNTDAPARQATLSTPPPVYRPCVVRQESVLCPFAARSSSVDSPLIVRIKPATRP